MKLTKTLVSFIIGFTAVTIAYAQQKMLTVEDAVLKQRTSLAPDRLMQLQWVKGTEILSYVVKVNGKEYVIMVDAPRQVVDTVFSIDDFQTLFKTLEMEAPPQRLPFITWLSKEEFRFFYSNAYYTMNIVTKQAKVITKVPKEAQDMEFEENTNRTAFTINNNVMVFEKDTWLKTNKNLDGASQTNDGAVEYKKTMITTDGAYGLVNGKAVHRNEFGITKGLFWSALGNKLAYYKMYEAGVSDYELMNFESKPGAFEKIKYPMAGAQSHVVKLWVQDYSKQRNFEVQTGNGIDQYLTNVAWSPQEDLIYIAIVNRDQNEMKLNQYDGRSGVFIKTLFTEKETKYVEPEHPPVFVKNDPGKFIWMSKRDGFNQLYLYNENGKLLSQLTKDKFDVVEFLGFDALGKTAFYIAATNNGLDRQCYSVDLTTGKNKLLTSASGVHSVLMSESGNHFVTTFSNAQIPRKTILMNRSLAELMVLLTAKNPLMDYASCTMKLGSIKAADNTTNLNYRMFYPSNFDSTRRYPVLVYLYGGPHAQMVTNSWFGGADLWLYYMAQQGYVVYTLDNRGSANRGRDFEQATYRNFGENERADQLQGIAFLRTLKFVDTTRVGVYGWSFGGFMSINMLTRTNAFKVGVAGGPVIDWSLYEIMYTERYMDKPQDNKEGYDVSTLTNYVNGLKGKLFIIHGTDDDVVLWQHSLTYVKKCVDAGVQVDYFVYPEHKHNVLGKDRVHLMQKITNYFKSNL